MNRELEKRLVPKLRFPEFEKDWRKVKLRDVSTYFNGKSFEGDVQEEGKYELITLKSIDMDGNLVHSKRYINIEVPTLSKGTLVMILSEQAPGLLGMTTMILLANKYVLNQRVAEIRPNNKVESYFLSMAINRNQRYFSKLGAGTKVQNISKPNVENYEFFYPTLTEQQKTANFLTAVDKRIQTLEKKKNFLEKYKKGVMQQLFKQELRFKDEKGNAFPEWEFLKLKEVLKRSKLKNTDEKVKYVLTNSATKGIVSQNDYFDKDIANQNNLQGYYVVEKNDFVYNPRISQTAPVGPFKRNKLAQGVMSPLYTVLRPKKGNLEFLEFYFETTLWHKYMKSIANYGVRHDRMNITISDFENLPIPYPSLEEQTKIANFLSAIDKNIALVSTKIEHTKTYKKGLLQQMFV